MACAPRRLEKVRERHQQMAAFVASALFFALTLAIHAQSGQAPAARDLHSGDAIYRAGCAGCHGGDGRGAPPSTIGFDKPSTFPDFADCAGTTPELDVDWRATITEGGHGRGFSPIMPAFAEELTPEQIDLVIQYLRGFCRDDRYPRGELNLPRPLRTEKAFPESETVLTVGASTHRAPTYEAELGYEHRLTARDQLEIAVPWSSVQGDGATRASGVGDVAIGWKRVLFASHDSIVSAQGEIALPSGNAGRDLGSGTTTFGAFASAGRMLPANAFVQAQVGTDQPTSTEQAPRTLFWRVAAGRSFRQEGGLGRIWSPMVEVVSDREFADGSRADVDVIPQFQVSLSRRQHVRANAGVQIPMTNTGARSTQVLFYVLWDWFDGRLTDGWR